MLLATALLLFQTPEFPPPPSAEHTAPKDAFVLGYLLAHDYTLPEVLDLMRQQQQIRCRPVPVSVLENDALNPDFVVPAGKTLHVTSLLSNSPTQAYVRDFDTSFDYVLAPASNEDYVPPGGFTSIPSGTRISVADGLGAGSQTAVMYGYLFDN